MEYGNGFRQRLPCVKGAPAIAGEGLFPPLVYGFTILPSRQAVPPSFTQGRLLVSANIHRSRYVRFVSFVILMCHPERSASGVELSPRERTRAEAKASPLGRRDLRTV